VIEAYQKLGIDLPVNLKLCLEGMEESGSLGLEEAIDSEMAKGDGSFFAGVDACCISDNYWCVAFCGVLQCMCHCCCSPRDCCWCAGLLLGFFFFFLFLCWSRLGTRKPCITYGLRGIITFMLKVTASTKDLHSGVHGGVVHEAVFDVMKVMSSMLNDDGRVTPRALCITSLFRDFIPLLFFGFLLILVGGLVLLPRHRDNRGRGHLRTFVHGDGSTASTSYLMGVDCACVMCSTEVAEMTDAERSTYDALDFDVDSYRESIGVRCVTTTWRAPS